MHIVHIASELAPIAKVGGLADVVYGLSKELAKTHQVEIFLPKYDVLDTKNLKKLHVEQKQLWLTEGAAHYSNTIWEANADGLKIFFIDPQHPKRYFNREQIYGCADDTERFTYFCKVVLTYLTQRESSPDVLHLHDWPAAFGAPLYKERYNALGLKVKTVVLTIHNLQHQGKCSPEMLDLPAAKEKMRDPASPDLSNILKGGILYADQITTVSPTYEKEIKTSKEGWGLDKILLENSFKLKGILNGIDTTFWNPEKDPFLVKSYNSKNIEKTLRAKKENRAHLCASLGMNPEKGPLVASVTRLVTQKGPELIRYGILKTLEKGGQFILLGSVFEPEIKKTFNALKTSLLNNKNVSICLKNDEELAHLIFASADMLLIPSLFEPCGLTQLISLRYGTIPIVRETGGLTDTVFDAETSSQPEKDRNGYTFEFPDPSGIDWALGRALECWEKNPKKWQTLVQQGMDTDFSWKRSAAEYVEVYRLSARLI